MRFNKLIRWLPIALILSLLAALLPANPVSAAGVLLGISPSSTSVQAGQAFSVNISVGAVNNPDLGNYKFDIGFDASVIQFVSVTAGLIGATNLTVSANFTQQGTITITHTQTGSGVIGNGSAPSYLARINFQSLTGTEGRFSPLSFANIDLRTFLGQAIEVSPENGDVVNVVYPPVNVTLSVPGYPIGDAGIVQVPQGDTFTVRINTSLVGNFNAYQFQFTYNPAVIRIDGLEDISGITSGQIDGTEIRVDHWSYDPPGDPTQGTIRVLGHIPNNVGATGDGYLAEVHFQVIGHNGDFCALSFTESADFKNRLFDSQQGNPISSVNWNGGLVSILSPYRITNHSPLPAGETGISYSQNGQPVVLGATGGVPTYSFSIQLGSLPLPAGLNLNPNGLISGVPTTTGTRTVTFKVTDSASVVTTRPLDITIVGPPTIISSSPLPRGQTNVFYSQSLLASGGLVPYSWSVQAGTLPAGLTLTATGTLSGTPTIPGVYTNIPIKITDSLGGTVTQLFAITINAGPAITNGSLLNGEINRAYFQTLTVTGGTAPFTWSISAGALPGGLTLNSSNGVVSGTPTIAGGPKEVYFTVTDHVGGTATKQFLITIANPPTITTTSLPSGEVNVPYSMNMAVSQGVAPFNWTLYSGSLPSGLTFSTSGVLAGQPTVITSTSITIKITDAYGAIDTQTLTITIMGAPVILTNSPMASGAQNRAYSQTLTASGGVSPYNWSQTAGTLPNGLTLSAGGVIAGTATATGTFNFTVKLTDAAGGFITKGFSITINPVPVISTTSLPDGEVNRPYSQTLSVTGGTPGFTWGVQSGSLPAGLTLAAATGVVSGTPTAAGNPTITFKVTDSLGIIATQAVSITILSTPTIATSFLTNGEVSAAYTQTLSATPGKGPYSWTTTTGTLPAGLTLAANTGIISGTPTSPGTSTLTFKVTDNLGGSGSRILAITVIAGPTITTNSPLAGGGLGKTYSQVLTAGGGVTPYSWSQTAGTLPTGLTLNAGGVFAGTATATGTFNFTVKVTDNAGGFATKSFSLTITAGPIISTTALADGEVSRPYTQTLAVTGGTPSFTWGIQSGTLPAGLTLAAATGVISGTPTAAANPTITFKVTDSLGVIATQAIAITIYSVPTIATSTLANGEATVVYSQTLSATPGKGPYNWTTTSGTLPGGLTLAADTGTIAGTPTVAGTSTLTFKVTDSLGGSGSRILAITVIAGPTITTNSPLAGGALGRAYSQTLAASGGVTPYSWSQTAGMLPTGLTLSAGGVFAGSATATGTFNFTVKVTDNAGGFATKSFSLTITAAPVISTTALADGEVSRPYSQTLAVTGGTPSFTWGIQSGTLPAGLTLAAATGVISGTPTAAANPTITFKVTDGLGIIDTQVIAITIYSVPTVATGALANGEVNLAYTQTLSATPGTGKGPYSWTPTTGTLPGGLTLAADTGIISGMPTSVGAFPVTFKVTDGLGGTATKSLTITIVAAVTITTNAALPAGEVTLSYSQTLLAANGAPAYSWSQTGGTLPTGLTLSTGGAIAGTATAPGTFNFTVKVTDILGGFTTKDFSITINPAPVITTTTLADGEVSRPYSQTTLAVTGGTSPFTWALQTGSPALPAGLALNAATGAITGTPTATGSPSITFKVTDSLGIIDTQVIAITIYSVPTIATGALANGEVNLAYTQTLSATPGTGKGPYSWTTTTGTLPGGLTLAADTGIISGMPTSVGAFPVTFKVTDGLGGTATKSLTITIVAAVTITTNAALPAGEVTLSYSQTLLAANGAPAYSWSQTGGTLPTGLTLSTGGAIAGTATAPGTFNFTVKVTDILGGFTTKDFSITINPAPVITTTTLADGEVSRPYSQTTLAVTGGTSPFTWALQTGSPALPAGLALNAATGAITGTPTATGSPSITFKVTDSLGIIDTQVIAITIYSVPTIATGALANGEVNLAYTQTLSATPGTGKGPYSWTTTTGTLPGGLTLAADTGIISGMPTSVGAFPVTFKVTDGLGGTATKSLTITIVAAVTITTNAALPAGEVTLSYSQTLLAANGAPAYSWSQTGGTLPTGLTLSTGGAIAGTATAPGTFNFTVKVNDVLGAVDSRQFAVTIAAAPAITTTSLPGGQTGLTYSSTLAATGGVSTYGWSIQSGSLPGGLSLTAATGGISGTPTTVGNFAFTVKVTDNLGVSATQGLSILIVDAPTITTDPQLPGGEVNVAYSQALTIAGGQGPYTWTLLSGALPAGLSFSASGVISGTPTQGGDFTIGVNVTDSFTASNVNSFSPSSLASKQFSLHIYEELGLTNSSLFEVLKGKACFRTCVASGGKSDYRFTASGLPPGLSMSTAGLISGIATVRGDFDVAVTVTDSLHSVTNHMTIKVYRPFDANGNGIVDMGDVVKVERIILMMDPATPAADADGDNSVDVADITKIERVILELDPAE